MLRVAREIAVCHNPHNSSGSGIIQGHLERIGAPSKDGPDKTASYRAIWGLDGKG